MMGQSAVVSHPGCGSKHPRRPRRLLLFVHYNKWGNLADYVVHLLKKVHKLYSRVVFISNSPMSQEDLVRLQGLYDDFFQRENTGFDFLAWKEALEREGREDLTSYDSVTLMNDTCFGPLFDLGDVYRQMEAREVDFWGLTNHAAMRVGKDSLLAKDGLVPEHIQSYFLCFQRGALASGAFSSFWAQVQEEEIPEDAVRKYETQLTGYLHKAGLKSAVLCDTTGMDQKFPNKTIEEPVTLLERQVPFIKLKAFFAGKAPENIFLLSQVAQHSRYPVQLIRDHLARHFSPEISIRVEAHSLDARKKRRKDRSRQRIALHIHAYYPDILRQMLRRFKRTVHSPVDIFLTTDSEDKATAIRQLLQRDFPHLQVPKLRVCENRGRDIWPWLQLAPELAAYDVAGHLHTKKTVVTVARYGMVWREELLDSLLGRFSQIRDAFAADPLLGIVIPDVPSIFKFPLYRYDYSSDTIGKRLLMETWKRLGSERPIDFPGMDMLVFPYGSMFWYRPKALEPLWQAHWDLHEIPEEPVPNHGTLLHALERLLVYVAWERGYDFCVAPQTVPQPTGFHNELAFCECRALNPAKKKVDQKTKTLQLLHGKMRGRLIGKKG